MLNPNQRPASLAEVARESSDETALSFHLRDFLDEFYAQPSPARLEEEPPLLADLLKDGGRADAYFAATADYLSRKYQFNAPGWTRSDQRTLRSPFFALESHAARMWLIVESPAPFRERNIFISADALTRA